MKPFWKGKSLKDRYLCQRAWFNSLPKAQRHYLIGAWLFGIFGMIWLIFFFACSFQLTGLWHSLSLVGAFATCAYFLCYGVLQYTYYLEKRIKALEEKKLNG